MLRLSDGGQAMMSGCPSYVRFWSARRAVEYNADYEVATWAPGFIGIGDDSGPDMVGFDTRQGEPYPVCALPYVPMDWEGAMGAVPDFATFIRQLLPKGASVTE